MRKMDGLGLELKLTELKVIGIELHCIMPKAVFCSALETRREKSWASVDRVTAS